MSGRARYDGHGGVTLGDADMGDAHVFGEGTFTLVVDGQGTISAFAGAKKLALISSVHVTGTEGDVPKVSLTFPKRTGSDVDLQVEEYMRAASHIPWVGVKRES